ncbi:IclR family transcriptional regulator domain-containing protein [Pseudomonas sp. D4-18]|uniref:IclR family transcriptional regulator domain-containing protein n=1 Tax=Pseudomonas sp. D4-18 TaxID=2817395 RepID=UPI003DA7BA4D
MSCLAAPIRDRFGHVIGGMSVSFRCFGFREELRQDYVKRLMEPTQQISAQLGWHLRGVPEICESVTGQKRLDFQSSTSCCPGSTDQGGRG